jgi:hypothetical protein
MSKAGYSLTTTANVALVAATVKTIICVIAPASFGIDLKKLHIGFDGVTAADKSIMIDICTSTLATNSTPGTNNTTGVVNQIYGRAITAGFTGFFASTLEPTVLTPVWSWPLTPNGGTALYDIPLGDTLDTPVSTGIAVRVTPNASLVSTNCRATLFFERC